MIEILDPGDSRAVRNKNNVLELYELMTTPNGQRKARPDSSGPGTSSTTR